MQSQGRDYKATVLIYLDGGLDSFNMLVPVANCAYDLYSMYQQVRGETLALSQSSSDIGVPSGTQPCDTFGIHEQLPLFEQLWNDGDLSFIANIGSLIEPLASVDEYKRAEKAIPSQLFSHNTQTKQAQSVHAQNPSSKGVLGRMIDALKTQDPAPFRTNAFSIAGNMKAVEGEAAAMIDRKTGVAD